MEKQESRERIAALLFNEKGSGAQLLRLRPATRASIPSPRSALVLGSGI
jgi:hypothetical protein